MGFYRKKLEKIMKPLFRNGRYIAVIFLLSCLLTTFSPASEFRYLIPGNFVMTLGPAPEAIGPKVLSLVAKVRARVGMPKNLEIYFESTPDFKIIPEKAIVSCLATEPVSTNLTVTKVGKLAAGKPFESWVRMRVVYEPDYESLAQIVDDPSIYPDPNERRRLTERIMKNSQERARLTDAVRYFPELPTSRN